MGNSNDLAFVIGILLAVMSIPSLLNAWTEERAPRFGAMIGLTGLVLIGLAMSRHPGGYGLDDVLPAFRRVFNALLN
ncbi:MAG: 50S ribosomal protein L35 [Rhodobacter sp. CACIA14H1]|nr:MAG: 50S ribosomal protein L35 [Rhodobacter sp. CACIA14H1]